LKSKILTLHFFVLFVSGFSHPVIAEDNNGIYRWTDAQGRVHFGDDRAKVDNADVLTKAVKPATDVDAPIDKPAKHLSRKNRLITEFVEVEINITSHIPRTTYRFKEPLLPRAKVLTARLFEGSLWMAGYSGLIEFDLESEQWLLYEQASGLPGELVEDLEIIDGRILLDIRYWENGSLSDPVPYWLANGNYIKTNRDVKESRAGGRFNSKSSSLKHWNYNDALKFGGYTWLSSSGRYNNNTGVFEGGGVYKLRAISKRGKYFGLEEGLAHEYCYTLTHTSNESLWVSHYEVKRGLSVLHKGASNWSAVTHSNDGVELGGIDIVGLDHLLFIGQRGALVIYDTLSGYAYLLDESDGLPGYIVTDIHIDDDKNIWVSAYSSHAKKGQTSTGVMKLGYQNVLNLLKMVEQEARVDGELR